MEEGVKAKKSYSIRKVIVLTSLFAVWFAIPRRANPDNEASLSILVFFTLHQMSLFSLIAYTAWLLLGKRKWFGWMCTAVIVLFFGPLVSATVEKLSLGNSNITESLLNRVGLGDAYLFMYQAIFYEMGYDS